MAQHLGQSFPLSVNCRTAEQMGLEMVLGPFGTLFMLAPHRLPLIIATPGFLVHVAQWTEGCTLCRSPADEQYQILCSCKQIHHTFPPSGNIITIAPLGKNIVLPSGKYMNCV